MVPSERHVTGGPATAGERALRPPASRSLRPRTTPLPALAGRALPVLGRSMAGLALGFATEYALRSLSRTVVGALSASPRGIAAATRGSAVGSITRTVVTELVVVEPARRS